MVMSNDKRSEGKIEKSKIIILIERSTSDFVKIPMQISNSMQCSSAIHLRLKRGNDSKKHNLFHWIPIQLHSIRKMV